MLSSGVLLSIAIICAVIYFWCKYHYNHWRRHGIPFIEPTPLLGNTETMFTLRKNFGLYLSDVYNDKRMLNEPVVGIYTLHQPALVIRDLDLYRAILIKDFNKFPNRYGSCDPHGDVLGNNNLFFVKNPAWKEIRTKLTPVYTSGKIKQMFPLMQEIAGELESHLASYGQGADGFVVEVKLISSLFTTDLIASTAFGIQVNSLKNPSNEFRKKAHKIVDFSLSRAATFFVVFFLPKWSSFFRVKMFPEDYTQFLRNIVENVMSQRKKSGNVRNDLIDLMLALKKNATSNDTKDATSMWSNDFLLAQAAVFLTAGFETSSSTMAFALYELSRKPELQRRLRQEIHEALVAGNGNISYEEVQSLEYLRMVVDEVLRMYPVLPFLDRECVAGSEGFSLKPHLDYVVPDGMPVFLPIFALQRDPKYWKNPDQFDPERFSAENRKTINPMTYMPFGTGPHNCIGSRIGLLQSKLGLVHILKNHQVTTCEQTVPEMHFNPKALILQSKSGIYLRVTYDGLYDNNISAP